MKLGNGLAVLIGMTGLLASSSAARADDSAAPAATTSPSPSSAKPSAAPSPSQSAEEHKAALEAKRAAHREFRLKERQKRWDFEDQARNEQRGFDDQFRKEQRDFETTNEDKLDNTTDTKDRNEIIKKIQDTHKKWEQTRADHKKKMDSEYKTFNDQLQKDRKEFEDSQAKK